MGDLALGAAALINSQLLVEVPQRRLRAPLEGGVLRYRPTVGEHRLLARRGRQHPADQLGF
jgi:hypothetical protein